MKKTATYLRDRKAAGNVRHLKPEEQAAWEQSP